MLTKLECFDAAGSVCGTSYYTYFPENTTDATKTSKTPPADPRNDVMLTASDGRSATANDTTYRTTYAYDTAGYPTTTTAPLGRVTTEAYTKANETPAAKGGGTSRHRA